MPRSRLWQLGSVALRLGVGGSFALAAILKLRAPATFAEQIANYQLLPELSNFIAITLPSIELATAIALVIGPKHWRHAATLVLLGLLVVFTASIARAWALGINLECGCFGIGSTNIGPWPILRNSALGTALVLALLLEPRRLGAN